MKACINIIGLKGSGKDTVAEIIQTLYPDCEWKKIKFAKKLKEACSKATKLGTDWFEDAKLKEKVLDDPIVFDWPQCHIVLEEFGIDGAPIRFYRQKFHTTRKMLQYVGTDLLRKIEPLIHVNITLSELEDEGLFICTDTRFKNEFVGLESYFGDKLFSFYVERSGVSSNDHHQSELQIKKLRDKCEIINNNGTLEDLRETVNSVILENVFNKLGN